MIASRIGSLAEVVEDGVTGLLVEPGSVEDLAGRLRWAGLNAEALAEMGVNARGRADTRYAAAPHLAALLGVYARASGQGQERRAVG